MSVTTVAPFESTVHTSNVWLRQIMDEMEWTDHQRAYHALRAVLHSLRDLLTLEEVVDLGAQLPMLVRGLFYEGWNPSRPVRRHKHDVFLDRIRTAFSHDPDVHPEAVAWAVLKTLQNHVSAGEIRDILHVLPEPMRSLWPGSR